MTNEQRTLINHFLEKYKNLYPDYLQDDFQDKIYKGYTLNNDIINQIYCYLNCVDLEKTDYYHFFKYLEKNHLLNGKLLEVGCGAIPILSNILYEHQYKITALDKKIIIKDFHFSMIEQELDDSFDFRKYDTIIAFRPCMATEIIIRNCLKNNISFCIYLCNCALYPQEMNYSFNKNNWKNEDWVQYLKKVVKKYNQHNMIIKIDYNTTMFDNCPIILARKNV